MYCSAYTPMIYRKAPAHPPRLLLRIVAAAGASALLGATACSSTSSAGGGSIPIYSDSGSNHDSATEQDSASDAPGDELSNFCDGVCGLADSGGFFTNPEAGDGEAGSTPEGGTD